MSSFGISFVEFQAIQKNAFKNIFKDVSPELADGESFQLESKKSQPSTPLSTKNKTFSNSSSKKFSPAFNAKRANLEKVIEKIKKEMVTNDREKANGFVMGIKKLRNYQKYPPGAKTLRRRGRPRKVQPV